ncbi:MAG: response regulator, partial [Rhodothermales bacterium]|nr:response regulator [Rhodothermales bacterium]
VVTVSSGSEAIERAAAESPDLILIDVMMPEMDGPATLARLREQEPTAETPVIFLTASSEIDRFRDLGVAGVIAKPFDPLTLPDEVRKILE